VHLECAFYLPSWSCSRSAARRGRRVVLVAMTIALAAQALAAYSLAYPAFAAVIRSSSCWRSRRAYRRDGSDGRSPAWSPPP
jgi:hypothetical protein